MAEKLCYPILIKRITLIEMFFMLHNAVLANKGSVIAAVVIGIGFRMIFAEYLEQVLSLSNHIFDLMIYLERKLFVSVKIAVVMAMAISAFKVILLSYTSLSILRGLDHLGFHARSAGSHGCTANHNNRFS